MPRVKQTPMHQKDRERSERRRQKEERSLVFCNGGLFRRHERTKRGVAVSGYFSELCEIPSMIGLECPLSYCLFPDKSLKSSSHHSSGAPSPHSLGLSSNSTLELIAKSPIKCDSLGLVIGESLRNDDAGITLSEWNSTEILAESEMCLSSFISSSSLSSSMLTKDIIKRETTVRNQVIQELNRGIGNLRRSIRGINTSIDSDLIYRITHPMNSALSADHSSPLTPSADASTTDDSATKLDSDTMQQVPHLSVLTPSASAGSSLSSSLSSSSSNPTFSESSTEELNRKDGSPNRIEMITNYKTLIKRYSVNINAAKQICIRINDRCINHLLNFESHLNNGEKLIYIDSKTLEISYDGSLLSRNNYRCFDETIMSFYCTLFTFASVCHRLCNEWMSKLNELTYLLTSQITSINSSSMRGGRTMMMIAGQFHSNHNNHNTNHQKRPLHSGMKDSRRVNSDMNLCMRVIRKGVTMDNFEKYFYQRRNETKKWIFLLLIGHSINIGRFEMIEKKIVEFIIKKMKPVKKKSKEEEKEEDGDDDESSLLLLSIEERRSKVLSKKETMLNDDYLKNEILWPLFQIVFHRDQFHIELTHSKELFDQCVFDICQS